MIRNHNPLDSGVRLILFVSFFLAGIRASAQEQAEFRYHKNGLIYSEDAMKQLHRVVDSLNLKHKQCDVWKDRYAIQQATGHYIEIETNDPDAVINKMKRGIPFDSLVYIYPDAQWEEGIYITREKIMWDGKSRSYISAVAIENMTAQGFSVEGAQLNNLKVRNKWLYKKYEDQVQAFYMTSDFKQPKIPHRYSKYMQYVDCLIDTATTVFYEGAATEGGIFASEDTVTTPAYTAFINHLEEKARELYGTKASGVSYSWNKRRFEIVDSVSKVDSVFYTTLRDACNEALAKKKSNEFLEEMAERFYGKNAALELIRNRIVYGTCSEDLAPRLHSLKLATLAAASMRWDIFLRAHLDILNDNFRRSTDGSYAYGERLTYLKEIEALNINTLDLMMGIALRGQHPAKHHYQGDIRRIGRALSEAADKSEVEERFRESIRDKSLDPLNRLQLLYVYRNYIGYLKDVNRQKENIAVLEALNNYFPDEISKVLRRYPLKL